MAEGVKICPHVIIITGLSYLPTYLHTYLPTFPLAAALAAAGVFFSVDDDDDDDMYGVIA